MKKDFEINYSFHRDEYGLLAPYMSTAAYEYIVKRNKNLENMLDFESIKKANYGSDATEKLKVRYDLTNKDNVQNIENYLDSFIELINKHKDKLLSKLSLIEESSEMYTVLEKILQNNKTKSPLSLKN